MGEFKHFSFDVWNTLIARNDVYREKREEFFRFYFAGKGVELKQGQLDETMIDVWNYFDQLSKLFGKAPNPLEMYAMVVFRITGKLSGISQLEMSMMYKKMEELFLKYPPTLYDRETKYVLEELSKRGKTLSILSNTSYIKGSTISQALEILQIGHLFKYKIFSDELGHSKPHIICFQEVEKLAQKHCNVKHSDEIIHIGDKELEDGQGAYEAGFGYFIINSGVNPYRIKDLL